ncbi:hypothetical protein cypCar_00041006, partial [Cyprinus carpio]
VFGADTNEIQSVSVMEGDSVSLNSDFAEMFNGDITWTFGAEKSLIVKIKIKKQIFSTFDGPDGRFRDRLKLDNQTGSLTITDSRTEHTGVYQLQMLAAKLLSKTFNVSVYAVQTFDEEITYAETTFNKRNVQKLNVKECTHVVYAPVTTRRSKNQQNSNEFEPVEKTYV